VAAVFLLLAVTWPIFLLVAAAIKLASPGPVLFRQVRVGLDGKQFQLVKFRSMHVDADRFGPGITGQNDPRIYPLGRLLRKWKLDELPQLFNVLQGNMTLVGPRPDLAEFCAGLGQQQRVILRLRPGVTGAATLVYRDEERMLSSHNQKGITQYYINTIYPDKVRLDLEYARKASFAGDLRILTQTVTAIFS
jgi:lipopolysaccharide/colanic/teichoic acid biosynthesis glycosyltransferase